jgi:hypothetical protein
MVASITFTATQTSKYLRITDNFPTTPAPKTSGLLVAGNANSVFPIDIETYDQNTGSVKVEVSRDGATFAEHDRNMRIDNGENYPIDDTYLPRRLKKDSHAA